MHGWTEQTEHDPVQGLFSSAEYEMQKMNKPPNEGILKGTCTEYRASNLCFIVYRLKRRWDDLSLDLKTHLYYFQ